VKFTELKIKRLKPRQNRYDVEEGLGFGVRVHSTGTKSWHYRYMLNGKAKRMTLGQYPAISLADARALHSAAYTSKQRGNDPMAKEKNATTISDMIPIYLDGYAKPNKKSWREDERILTVDVEPVIGSIDLITLRRRDVRDMLDLVQARGVNAAWQTLKVVRKMLNYAMEEELIYSNPCQTINISGLNPPRDRNLTFVEIVSWWHWIDKTTTSQPIKNGLKVMLLTLQRSAEVFGMTADEIDGDWWEIPKNRTKTKRNTHRVYLTPLAKSLLTDGKMCFPSEHSGNLINSNDVAKATRKFFKERKDPLKVGDDLVAAFTPRDLRRTGVTRMAELGVDEHIIGKVVNHAPSTVTGQVYNKYKYDSEKQAALEMWSEVVSEKVS
jgi:integrase